MFGDRRGTGDSRPSSHVGDTEKCVEGDRVRASMSRTTRWLGLNRGLPVILAVLIAVMATLFATTDTVSAVGEGVTITESGGSTDVTEGGATDTFTVVLDASPSFETVIVFVLGLVDVSVSTGALNFTSTTWNIPQEVTVTAVDDSDVEGSHTDSIILVVFTINEASPWNADAIDPPPLTVNITDNDPATLTVIKTVITDDGGTASAGDWTMNVNGTDVSNASFAGSETGVMVTLDAGTYSVSESGGPSGYTMSLSADCSGTIALGESLTCTITNNDPATLTVIKTVITDDGGTAVASDWTMDITGGNPSDTGFAGSESGLTVALDPGSTYSVSERAAAHPVTL